ncbi:Holliday junction resolvase RuvX [Methylocaldum szegediense]|uniref:Putative pre-16S rRNA nuclease n=1 Tax=Methylocaldum szegediense TaxID=73780 RepID=A0ABN8X532_9GAMM|nr:Holliday junction resolvase RuvX [Methylocaldum szegediense]CAI8882104.1 putative pre-16S rRNA nuclease [Methylocaldum szegediense]
MDFDSTSRKTNESTYLGFDFGEKNIGVAVGQRVTGTATALETIRVTSKKALWDAVSRLVQTWRPSAFVVGLPYNPEGEENPIVEPIRRFCRQLESRYHLPVHTMDETLSTRESREIFYRRRSKRSTHFADVKDEIAAQLILQTWLAHTAEKDAQHVR